MLRRSMGRVLAQTVVLIACIGCGPAEHPSQQVEGATRSSARASSALTVSSCPQPEAVGPRFVLYGDALGDCVNDWSSATYDLGQTAVTHGGSAAIAFEPSSWSYLYFTRQGLRSSYTSLEFWVHGGTSGDPPIDLIVDGGYSRLASVRLDELPGGVPAGTWTKVVVPFGMPSSSDVIIVKLQAATNDPGDTIYLDDLELVAADAGSCSGAAGSSCSDGNPCNGEEACDGAGACISGIPPELDDEDSCTVDQCDPLTGVTHEPAAPGAACMVGNVCGAFGSCDATGACIATSSPSEVPVYGDGVETCFQDWSWAVHDLHQTAVVHEGGYAIQYEPTPWMDIVFVANDIAASFSGLEFWVNGGSSGGQQVQVEIDNNWAPIYSGDLEDALGHPIAAQTWEHVVLPFSSASVPGSILLKAWSTTPDQGSLFLDDIHLLIGGDARCAGKSLGDSCSDGNICNGEEVCDGMGSCMAGAPLTLPTAGACMAVSCDATVGIVQTPVSAGTSCSDGNACNGPEACDGAGACGAGTPPAVDDGNPCTVDSCDPAGGVVHTAAAAGSSCSDGNACNGAETCNGAGVCVAGSPPVVDDGNPCTIDSCDAAGGVTHMPAPAGTSCSDGNVCNGPGSCSGAGVCQAGAPLAVDDGNACTVDACYPGVGIVHSPIPGCGVLPPDPATIAPANDRSVTTDIASTTAFLYSGSNPIQTGVALDTIEPRRAAVVRGRVADRDGAPLGGVKVTILSHSEYGSTLTRADGMFDMAVNGGGKLVVNYQKDGYLPAQRQVQVPWRDFAWAEKVVLVPFDTVISTVASNAAGMQVARGSPITDSDGSRQTTVLFPAGTTAAMTLQDGSSVTLGTMHVRATEYTVGENGRLAMPGELGPSTAYTFAVELSVDEAVMANATTVNFSKALPVYVENFLNFPVGFAVPSGYYDRAKAVWVPSEDGRVIKIVSTSSGVATLDLTGDGVAESSAALAAIGITTAELQSLASLYQSGQTLWRVPVPHFTPFDFNPGRGCKLDTDGKACAPPDDQGPLLAKREPDPNITCGSIIECENQGLGEQVGVTGTPFSLSYRSTRQSGRAAERIITIPRPSRISSEAKGVVYEVFVAGQRFSGFFPANGGPAVVSWDGNDAYGRPYQGETPVVVKTGFLYRPVYMSQAAVAGFAARSFGNAGGGTGGAISFMGEERWWLNQGPRDDDVEFSGFLVRWNRWSGTFYAYSALPEGLGGWTLSPHHTYDPVAKAVMRGDGSTEKATTLNSSVISSYAQTGWPYALAMGADGSVYAAQWDNIQKIDPTGKVTRYAGRGASTAPQSGISALNATVSAYDIAVGPDGSIYTVGGPVAYASPVRRIRPDGIIEDFAGVHPEVADTTADGNERPALQANIQAGASVAVGPDGSVYILAEDRIRKVTPDGYIHHVAGTGTCLNTGDGGPAKTAGICGSYANGQIRVGPDDSIYLADYNNAVVRRISPDGIITRFAGTGTRGFGGDGGFATAALLSLPSGVSIGPDGSVYISDLGTKRVRRVSPAGIIDTVAGTGNGNATGDGGPALSAGLHNPRRAEVGPNGDLFIADSEVGRVRRVSSPMPGFSVSEFVVPAQDRSALYVFNAAGRHLRTLDPLTKSTIYSFGYDSAGRLAMLTDRDGLLTTIQHDGASTTIVAPFGQRTVLTLDAHGYASTITNPASESQSYAYDALGLMQSYTDPRGFGHAFHYDSLGRLYLDENPAGGSKTLSRTDGPNSLRVSVTTALGRSTLHDIVSVSSTKDRRTLTRPDGTAAVRDIAANGSESDTSPDGTLSAWALGPDPQFGMAAPITSSWLVKTPTGLTKVGSASSTVSLKTASDPLTLNTRTDQVTVNGRTASTVYNAAAQTLTTTTAGGRTYVTTLDATGRVASVQAPGVPLLVFGRDANGLLRTVTQGGRVSRLDDYAGGLPQLVTDPAGRQVRLSYDSAGRVQTQLMPGNRLVGLGYDLSGNLNAVTPPGQPTHGFTSDAVDQLSTYTPPLAANTGGLSTTYGYDRDGALSSVLLPDGASIVPGYDSAGRLWTLTTARGVTQFGYDSRGRLGSLGTPENQWLVLGYDGFLPISETATGWAPGVVSRTFDSDFRQATVSVNGARVATFTYDADSLLTGVGQLSTPRDATTGRVSSTTLGVARTTPGYSAYGEQDSVTATVSGSTVYAYTLHRDLSGKIIGKTETIQGVTSEYVYTPDAAGRLGVVTKNGATVESYTYDDNGNRLTGMTGGVVSVAGTVDAQDRLPSYGNATFSYGPSGDLQTKTVGGQVSTYSYDALGNLLQATVGANIINYVVDGLNRRVGKQVNGVMVEGFLYDGQLRPVAWLDGAGNVKATFVYGLHVNVPEYMNTATGTYRFIHDHLGSPRLVVDSASGAVVERIDYDSYGNVQQDTNPGFQPFGFAGGLYDRDTGLVRFGARDYDPVTGRWTNKDPLGLEGGLNLYEYAGGDPVNFVDPSGLKCRPYWQRVADNFILTNKAIPGMLAPTGLGLMTAGATAKALDGITLGRWILSGFRGASMGAATFTGAETGVIAGATAVSNFAFVSLAFEAGVFVGSLIEAGLEGDGGGCDGTCG